MTKRRELTRKEQKDILSRMKNLRPDIEDSYNYPLQDLIDYLENNTSARYEGKNKIETGDDGIPSYLFLYFTSPRNTWQNLCGVEGIYKIDAATLRAIDFLYLRLN